ncbi:MAG TPA: exodeoxyribonuclease VII large subunit [Vicinamibacterales bacterium]|nr:exodeoxyribonuclease VII large subunit [Vicinamibacterales bacterium]
MPDDLFSVPFEQDDDRQAAAPTRARRQVLTVSELTASIRGLIESGFGDVWVEGEISNCKLWNTGHLYFTLKDGRAQLKVVMFRSALRYLRFKTEDGQHVVARGRLGVYDAKGEYQLVCEHLEPRGLGALQLAFEQLKKRLQAEGLFDASRKRPLPALPARIGIVTSLEGAALRDIIKVLRRRYPTAHLVIRPARVQGDGAAEDVARALTAVARVRGVDVVIVGRGGGSVEDLWTFNEERVARAMAACPVPVIAAVGHEVDVTIADFVADVRAPTPSAAAEMVVAAKDEFAARIDRLSHRLLAAVRGGLQRRRTLVHVLSSRRGLAGWHARLAFRGRHAAELSHQLRGAMVAGLGRREREFRTLRLRLEALDLRRRLAAIQGRLQASNARLAAAGRRRYARADGRLTELAGRLESLSPLAVLARGYAVCWNADRTAIIRSARTAAPGDHVTVTLHEGELSCEVRRTTEG